MSLRNVLFVFLILFLIGIYFLENNKGFDFAPGELKNIKELRSNI